MVRLISRLGNKTNDIKYFKKYLPENIKIIVEPFAGSFALSAKLYSSDEYDTHINDNDENLLWIYNNYEKFIKYRQRINESAERKEGFKYADTQIVKKAINEIIEEEFIKDYFIKTYFVRGCVFKQIKNLVIDKCEIDILKKSKITNYDYTEVLDMYKDNCDAFIFLDPPYMFSNNTNYQSQFEKMDNTDMLYIFHDYMKICKCKVMLIINDLKIIRYIYGDMVKDNYIITYQLSNKKSSHLIICNY